MKLLTATVLASALAALTLTACSGRVLDYRNMTVSGGKIYAQNGDTPFSGKVTNVPFQTAVPTGSWIGLMQGATAALNKITYFNGGNWLASVCDLSVKDGYRDGSATCKDPNNGSKYYELSFNKGTPDGDVTIYSNLGNGKPAATATIANGRIEGDLKIFSVSSGALISKKTYKDGTLILSEDYDAGTGKVIGVFKRGPTPQDPSVKVEYSGSGKRTYYAEANHLGVITGNVYTFYPETGYLKGCKGSTPLLQWSPDGKLILESADANDDRLPNWVADCIAHLPSDTPGVDRLEKNAVVKTMPESPKTQPTPVGTIATIADTKGAIEGEDRTDWPKENNACTQAWATAFRKESGADAAISYDMAWEWVDSCRAGKHPH